MRSAGALILRGDKKHALSSLATVATGGPARLRWHQEMIDRAKLMADLLRHGGLDRPETIGRKILRTDVAETVTPSLRTYRTTRT